MKTRHSKHSIPTDFSGCPFGKIFFEASIRPSRHSRLRAKVLVFESERVMRSFWKKAFGSDLGNDCHGAVNGLGCDVENTSTGERWREVDRNFFCVIGFTLDKLSTEVLTHESVHAGFAYVKRLGARGYSDEADPAEESVCYPSGVIAARINDLFYERGVYAAFEARKKKSVSH